MADEVLKCIDCSIEFVFSERDQEFFATKGFLKPRRCRECRKARKGDKVFGSAGGTDAPQMRSYTAHPRPAPQVQWVNELPDSEPKGGSGPGGRGSKRRNSGGW